MRMFIAALPPQQAVRELSALSARLREKVSANYTSEQNYHMTLAFLGDTPYAKTAEIERIIQDAAEGQGPVEMAFSHIGFFGKPHNAILWCGAEGAQPLVKMSERIREGLGLAGIPFDPKPMKPHITLARKADISRIRLEAFKPAQTKMRIDTVALMASERINGALAYTPVVQCRIGM